MKITDLIQKLEDVLKQHDNLRIVTKGFDEWDFDDIAEIKIIYILPNIYTGSHCGIHGKATIDTPDAEKALFIDF